MARAFPLVFATGVTAGALIGLPAVLLLPVVTSVVVALARQRPLVLAVMALLGALTGYVRVSSYDVGSLNPNVMTAVEIEGTIETVPQIGPSGPRATIAVSRVRTEDGGDWEDSGGNVLVFLGDTVESDVMRGDRVQMRASVQGIASLAPDFRRFVRSEGASGVAWAYATIVSARGNQPLGVLVRLRRAITARILEAVPGDAGALLAGFVTGDDSQLSEAARTAFEQTNTSHITAVSGGNVGILLAMWGLLIPEGRIRRHLVTQLTLIASVWVYVGLVGFGPASLRAALFATLLIPASRFGRKADAMTSLMLASAMLLLLKPALADSVGYWLSMAASAALVTVIPIASADRGVNLRNILVGLVAAQIATLPITVWIFGQWSPASFAANLIIGPLVSLLMPLAFVFSGLLFVSSLFGNVLGWIPAIGAEIILAIVRSLSEGFPTMRSGSITSTGVVLLSLLCGAVMATISVDFRRWIDRIEFAHRNGTGMVPASLVGVATGVAIGLLAVRLF